jgi:uncharacterized protein
MALSPREGELLLDLVAGSIEAALPTGREALMPALGSPAGLEAEGATFVTLRVDGCLRGCCGTLDAERSLAADVWHNAWAAGFADPRFAPLRECEWHATEFSISVLSALEPLAAECESELVASLRPGLDGLVIAAGHRRATFLPAVWAQLPEPPEFVRQLKLKAGLAEHYWSPDVRLQRYTTHHIGPRGARRAAQDRW